MFATLSLATEVVNASYLPSPQGAAFVELVNDSTAAAQYLVEIQAYRGGESRSGGLATIAEISLATVPTGGGVNTGLTTLRYADRDWIGEPDDADFPNEYYEGRVTVPLVMERLMPLLPEESRRVQRQFGIVEIANGDGILDSIVQSMAVDGRRVRILFGPYLAAYSDFVAIADIVATAWEADDLTVRLGLRDRSYNLDLPLQTNLYAGTGGAEGGAEITGKPKPLLFGRCRNVTPIAIDPTNLIFQVHDGEIFAVDAVYDRGAALTDSTDDAANYAALVALSVSAGEFATCKALGLFKLGSSPAGLITADIRGDVDPDYADTLDVIALRILKTRAGLSAAFINHATFAGAAAAAVGELGLFISSNDLPSTADVMSVMLGSIGGWWGAARDGRIRAGRLFAPEDRTPNMYLDQYDVLTLEPISAPVPRWRQRVAYQRNWTVQRGEDLAATVVDTRRQFLVESARAVTASDVSVRTRHAQALDPDPVQSLFESSTAAQDLADYLLALYTSGRRLFRITLKRKGYILDLQKVVRLTWPRLGLATGQNFCVIGIREDADKDETQLLVWG